jgi:hypothetical protein
MIAGISPRLKPKGPFSRLASVERVLAQMSEHKRVLRRDPEQPTEGGRDKRAQGAAGSVGCVWWRLPLIRQCADSARNVRAIINALPTISFPHIAEARDG